MARRKKSSRKRRSDRRKRPTTKAVKTSALPVTLFRHLDGTSTTRVRTKSRVDMPNDNANKMLRAN